MNIIIIINNVRYEVLEDIVVVHRYSKHIYYRSLVLKMNEAEMFQAECVDPDIFIVRELILLNAKLR